MNAPIIFKIPKLDDQDKILALIEKILKEYDLSISPSETDKDLSDIHHYYFKNNGLFEILEENGALIGTYGLYAISKAVCELRKMYLLPSHQGKGLGKLIMDRAIQKAKELGYKTMILETNQKLDKAVGLYKKYGFIEYQPDHLSDRCDIAMKKELSTDNKT